MYYTEVPEQGHIRRSLVVEQVKDSGGVTSVAQVAVVAPVQTLAWEVLYATGMAKKKKKKKKILKWGRVNAGRKKDTG